MNLGIAICTYNRYNNLGKVIEGVLKTKPSDAKIIICDDGSTDDTPYICSQFSNITYIRGKNLGVGANKNRALFALQDCHFLAILEDDLVPIEKGWMEDYENAYMATGIHHFCRVQEDQVGESIPDFSTWMKSKGFSPIYAPNVRGDLTILTSKVLKKVGGMHKDFLGVGYAHKEWSNRVWKANLIPHPNRWVDFQEIANKFQQLGDTEGGRWLRSKKEVKEEIKRNGALFKKLRATNYIYHPLIFP